MTYGTPLHCAKCGSYGVLMDNGHTPKRVIDGEWPCVKCQAPMLRSLDPDLPTNKLPWYWLQMVYRCNPAAVN